MVCGILQNGFLFIYLRVYCSAMANAVTRIYRFYRDGFREMRVGRTLWAIILVKLFIMFAILKLFFFRDPLAGQSESQRADAIMENITTVHNGENQQHN